MGKKVMIFLTVWICFFLIPTAIPASDVIENNNSGIPDQELYQSILEELGKKPNQKFTRQEAEKIQALTAAPHEIKSLKGIKYLKNLKNLNLTGSNLKNLNGIEDLIKLETLDVSYNLIKSVKPLKKLNKAMLPL